jgi:integrase/recombinase XerC
MPYLSPPTLTRSEQQTLLEASSVHPRGHVIFSLALGTGLRLSEIIGLDVGDVFFPTGRPRTRVRLRREIAKGGRVGDVFLPDALLRKLERFWGYKLVSGESVVPHAPLLCNQAGQRLSNRRLQTAFKHWQREAGFDRLYPVHALRHTAVTNVWRASHDLFLAQRFARHVSPLTTTIYMHASDEELAEGVRGLQC